MVLRLLSRLLLTRAVRANPYRGMVVLGGLLLLFTLVTPGALAGTGWCRTDPAIAIDGHLANVFVSAPLDAPLLVTGPTHIVVTVPPGVDTILVASSLGFGQGEIVEFAESPSLKATAESIDVRIKVYVPATDDTMPVLVEFAPEVVGILAPAAAEGTANTWISVKTEM